MQIVCPHCTTSYAVDPATFGSGGRMVRCARCKETWLAFPEEAAARTLTPAADDDDWGMPPPEAPDMPVVSSPSISTDLPDDSHADVETEWAAMARQDAEHFDASDDHLEPEADNTGWKARLGLSKLSLGPLARIRFGQLPFPLAAALRIRPPMGLPAACAVMAALVIGLVTWRADIVRLMPQTAAFFKMVGLGVNLRGLAFDDVRIATELVDNKPVLVIEGNIVQAGKKPVDIPRLRFVVRDAHGTEVYAWNAVLDQSSRKPGEKVWFKSRLASPPAEGRDITVRFFSRRDLAAGGA